jgi:hypothetical protein
MSIRPCVVAYGSEHITFPCGEVLDFWKDGSTVYLNAKPAGKLGPALASLANKNIKVHIETKGKVVVEYGEVATYGNLCNKKYIPFVIDEIDDENKAKMMGRVKLALKPPRHRPADQCEFCNYFDKSGVKGEPCKCLKFFTMTFPWQVCDEFNDKKT